MKTSFSSRSIPYFSPASRPSRNGARIERTEVVSFRSSRSFSRRFKMRGAIIVYRPRPSFISPEVEVCWAGTGRPRSVRGSPRGLRRPPDNLIVEAVAFAAGSPRLISFQPQASTNPSSKAGREAANGERQGKLPSAWLSRLLTRHNSDAESQVLFFNDGGVRRSRAVVVPLGMRWL